MLVQDRITARALRPFLVFEAIFSIGGRLSITRGVNGGNSVVCDVPTKINFAATA
jgi:hypothetical protein